MRKRKTRHLMRMKRRKRNERTDMTETGKRRPLVGLTPQYETENERAWMSHAYTDAVLAAGGIPVMLTAFTDPAALHSLCAQLDGILFTGGPDIHPNRYGEEVLPECGAITEIRDRLELALYEEAMAQDMPLFGICRGVQLLNVAAGGTLYQDIGPHPRGVMHRVHAAEGSSLYGIIGEETFSVNSFHHQAVKQPAPGCICSAVNEEGFTEAIEMPGRTRFWLGVQWHPERLYTDDPHAMALFDRFVSACAAFGEEKRK